MVAHLAHHLLTSLPAPLLPYIRDDFGLDYAQSGMVVSAFGIAYGIGQIPAGVLADRIGPRKVITVGICGVAIVGLMVGLSQTFIMMLVFLALMGIVGGGYHPAAAPLITDSVAPEKRGRALGIHLIGGSGSNFLAPLIAVGIASVWGWRGSFLGLAVPTMILGVVFYRILGRQAGNREVRQEISSQPEESSSSPVHWRQLIAFMVLSVVVQGLIMSVMAFIPLFMVDHFGVAQQTGAVFLSLVFFAGLWSSPLGGYLSDRLGTIPVTLVATLITGPVLFLLPLVPYGPLGTGIGVLLLVFGMLMFIRMPVAEAFIMARTTERNRSTILGIYYFTNMVVGALLAPVMGLLIDKYGFTASFMAAGGLILVTTLAASLFLIGNRR
ncbi:MAG: MFS transporter [Dehalococcoidales bacterium]